MKLYEGWIDGVRKVISPHCDLRPEGETPSLLIIHNISLPPGKFGGSYIDQLFMGTLNPKDDLFFGEINHLRVSAHCLIRRDGEIVQYPDIHDKITGHSDIAPGRKTDPGPYFYWEHYRQLLKE
ncbi:hypothetical protein [Xenorhabdus japonica]|uniref:1,6-anhydro-N-acetylmuramyl-L-alanine amidase AmpD n=1 Tax=Xenorhabdus japonica TaxID=53341 RepID=A0A1I5BSR7_9GAMM|nr:hypothetical protein [Xenorhabdus japonica]SFN77794.1 AmpD protein [Xenorhabdus japonica]